jgi:hypothetical protein
MRTRIQGLSQSNKRKPLVEGKYRARVVRFEPAGHAAKPCRTATFLSLDPTAHSGRYVQTRLCCHDRALWKLRWFLSDFGYDAELMAAEELDDRRVVGLEGVIRLAYWGTDGHRRLDVQGFAPADRWPEVSRQLENGARTPESAPAKESRKE